MPPRRLVLLGDGTHSTASWHLGYYDADLLVGVVIRRLGRSRPGRAA